MHRHLLVLLLVAPLALPAGAQEKKPKPGAIVGKVTAGVHVRIIIKKTGTDADDPKNVVGDKTLKKGGKFSFKKIPPGKYDILFKPQGKALGKFMSDRYYVEVASGKARGLSLRLTPSKAKQKVDEVIVAFGGGTLEKDALALIKKAGCQPRSKVRRTGSTFRYVVDIPDNKTVDAIVKAFKKTGKVKYAEPNYIARAN